MCISFYIENCFESLGGFKLLSLQEIAKSYKDKKILTHVSIEIQKGTVLAIAGKNGSGKSTLLNIIAGLIKPDKGQVQLGGTLGFVPQSDYLFDDMTVKDNLHFWAAAKGVSKKSLSTNQYIDLLDIGEFQSKRIKDLSGGMKRRTTICASLLHDPEIILLDEPFAGLDLFYKHELIQYLIKLKDIGKTIVYTSHNADEMVSLAHSVYLLYDGGLQAVPIEIETTNQTVLNQYILDSIKGE